MTRIHRGRNILQIAVLAAMLSMGPAMAADNDKGNSDHRSSRDSDKHDNDRRDGDKRDNDRRDGDRHEGDRRDHFERRQHDAVRTYTTTSTTAPGAARRAGEEARRVHAAGAGQEMANGPAAGA